MPSVLAMSAMNSAKAIARSMQDAGDSAEADFMPVMLMETESGTGLVNVAQFFASEQGRDALANYVLPQLIEDLKPTEIVMVNPVWAVSDDDGEFFEGMAAESPDRTEELMVVSVTHQGLEIMLAPVGRDPLGASPPTLGEFEAMHPESALRAAQSELLGMAISAMKRVHDERV